jgi:hypothetical protein
VNYGPRSILLHSYYRLLLHTLFTFSQTTIFYHTIHLILCLQQTGEIDNLTASWGKVLWLCCVQVPRCCWCKAMPQIRRHIYILSGGVAKPGSINLRKLLLSPTSLINLGFILRGDLLLCSSYLPLGAPNWVPTTHYQYYAAFPSLSWWGFKSVYVEFWYDYPIAKDS